MKRRPVPVSRRPLLLLPIVALAACKKGGEAQKPAEASKRL